MKVLLTGADGQLGRGLRRAFAKDELVAVTRADLDVTDEAAVHALMVALAPEVVVNAAAWTDVDGCEDDEDRAHLHNALAPWWLARACATVGARLLHVSTDYVFSGTPPTGDGAERRGWTEFDPVSPGNAYGRTKAAGEELIRATLDEHHIVRTSWLNGTEGGGSFVQTMLRLGRERGELEVVDDQVGAPTFVSDLAPALREVVVSGRFGTVNRTNRGWGSWYDLAAATFEEASLDVDLRPTTSERLARKAPRPGWSVLDDRHARLQGLTPLPPWRDGLRRMLVELARDGGFA